ncbi:hypothetical protein T439DRAFT_380793 [Meredithblackwellia eburnea MCA 4105]
MSYQLLGESYGAQYPVRRRDSRRRWLYLGGATCFVGAAVVRLSLTPHARQSLDYVRTSLPYVLQPYIFKQPSDPVCSSVEASLNGGHWAPRIPAFTSIDDFALGVEKSPEWDHECRTPDGNFSDSRTIASANWVWKPAHCKMREWNAEAFVLQLLGMSHGMFFIGDSLTKQFFKATGSAVGLGGTELLSEYPARLRKGEKPWPRLGGSEQFYLNPEHPLWSKALLDGYASRDRLMRPLVTKFTSYHLVSNKELVEAINQSGGNSSVGRLPNLYPWGQDDDFVPSLRAALTQYDSGLDSAGNIGSIENTVKTLVILGSGAHWGIGRLEGAPNREVAERAFAIAMNNVIERITSLPGASDQLRLLARTNPVPTEHCMNFTKPLEPPDFLPQAQYYNALSYPFFDNFFLSDPRLRTLDFRPLDGTRPDARRMPPRDCLHLCIPAARSWVYMLWNLM